MSCIDYLILLIKIQVTVRSNLENFASKNCAKLTKGAKYKKLQIQFPGELIRIFANFHHECIIVYSIWH